MEEQINETNIANEATGKEEKRATMEKLEERELHWNTGKVPAEDSKSWASSSDM